MQTRPELRALIEEATVDAYNEDEQASGFLSLIDENVELPFETKVLGAKVQVVEINQDDDGNLIAVCVRGAARQEIRLRDLVLPSNGPPGREWIEAYDLWSSGA